MKAILEFDLPEDEDAYKCARLGPIWGQYLHEIYQTARTALKHGDSSAESLREALEQIKQLADGAQE